MRAIHSLLRWRLAGGLVLLLALAALEVGCTSEEGPPPSTPDSSEVWFQDVTEASGLRFVHDVGPHPERYFMPHIAGSGAALFDFDNDGLLDVYLVQNAGPDSGATNRLFRQ